MTQVQEISTETLAHIAEQLTFHVNSTSKNVRGRRCQLSPAVERARAARPLRKSEASEPSTAPRRSAPEQHAER